MAEAYEGDVEPVRQYEENVEVTRDYNKPRSYVVESSLKPLYKENIETEKQGSYNEDISFYQDIPVKSADSDDNKFSIFGH